MNEYHYHAKCGIDRMKYELKFKVDEIKQIEEFIKRKWCLTPNWCSNDLRIEGELKEVEKFKKENVKLDFDKYIPYPKEFTDKDKQASKNRVEKQTTINGKLDTTDGYNSGGYEWCIQNWGTKCRFSSLPVRRLC